MLGKVSPLGYQLVSGAEADTLPDGSAVLIWAYSDGERCKNPRGAQVKDGLRWAGTCVMKSQLNPDWTYRVLWAASPEHTPEETP